MLAESLCSILLLEESSPRQVFTEFILARKAALQEIFHPCQHGKLLLFFTLQPVKSGNEGLKSQLTGTAMVNGAVLYKGSPLKLWQRLAILLPAGDCLDPCSWLRDQTLAAHYTTARQFVKASRIHKSWDKFGMAVQFSLFKFTVYVCYIQFI